MRFGPRPARIEPLQWKPCTCADPISLKIIHDTMDSPFIYPDNIMFANHGVG